MPFSRTLSFPVPVSIMTFPGRLLLHAPGGTGLSITVTKYAVHIVTKRVGWGLFSHH